MYIGEVLGEGMLEWRGKRVRRRRTMETQYTRWVLRV
jgi:hypothetical protein